MCRVLERADPEFPLFNLEEELQFLRVLRDHEEVICEEDGHQPTLLRDERASECAACGFDGEGTLERQRLSLEVNRCERDARVILIR